jgi:hypothetical protein
VTRQHITSALHHERALDLVLLAYAERGRPHDLGDAIDQTVRLYLDLCAEAKRIGRNDLLTPNPPTITRTHSWPTAANPPPAKAG